MKTTLIALGLGLALGSAALVYGSIYRATLKVTLGQGILLWFVQLVAIVLLYMAVVGVLMCLFMV